MASIFCASRSWRSRAACFSRACSRSVMSVTKDMTKSPPPIEASRMSTSTGRGFPSFRRWWDSKVRCPDRRRIVACFSQSRGVSGIAMSGARSFSSSSRE